MSLCKIRFSFKYLIANANYAAQFHIYSSGKCLFSFFIF